MSYGSSAGGDANFLPETYSFSFSLLYVAIKSIFKTLLHCFTFKMSLETMKRWTFQPNYRVSVNKIASYS